MLGGNGQPTASGNTPRSLEQLLERQWEQGSQFLMEQAQHFDSKETHIHWKVLELINIVFFLQLHHYSPVCIN